MQLQDRGQRQANRQNQGQELQQAQPKGAGQQALQQLRAQKRQLQAAGVNHVHRALVDHRPAKQNRHQLGQDNQQHAGQPGDQLGCVEPSGPAFQLVEAVDAFPGHKLLVQGQADRNQDGNQGQEEKNPLSRLVDQLFKWCKKQLFVITLRRNGNREQDLAAQE